MAKKGKTKTRAQVEAMQAKAVRFLNDVADKPDKADDIEDMSVEEYARHKHITIANPRGSSGTKSYAVKYRKPYGYGGGELSVQARTAKEARSKAHGILRVNESGDYRIESVRLERSNPRKKKPPLGSGARFAALERKIAARGGADDPAAVAAAIGRRKYGKKKFQELAVRGRRRRQRNPQPFAPGTRVQMKGRYGPAVKHGTVAEPRPNLNTREFTDVIWDDGHWGTVFTDSLKKETRIRRNPDVPLQEAAGLYREFHGRGPDKVLKMQMSEAQRGTYTALGWLSELKFKAPNKDHIHLSFEGNRVKLASSPDGNQLYLIGGDQVMPENLLRQFGAKGEKDFEALGEATSVTYITRKQFDGFKDIAYVHKFGEEGGYRPYGFYNRLQKTLILAGGSYHIEAPGIIN